MSEENKIERWKGRNSNKDRLRGKIWSSLEDTQVAIGNPWSTIPNFVGAAEAANRLSTLAVWKKANTVKVNPDAAQGPLRLLALQAGKKVFTPVPELVKDFPYILLDPEALTEKGIAFEDVMYSKGAMEFGQRCNFSDITPLDICVCGCVAVTRAGGRTGKGAGFADLEQALFRLYGVVNSSTPVMTTVHDIQVVEDELVVMQGHDTPLNIIVTPTELIETNTDYPEPGPLEWDKLQPDQFENIPFLNDLKAELLNK